MARLRDRKSKSTTRKRRLRRRVACATAWLGLTALLAGPGASWALDVTATTDSTTSQVTSSTGAVTTTAVDTTQSAATTVQSTTDAAVQTTQTAVQQTQSTVQTTVTQTASTGGSVASAPAPTRTGANTGSSTTRRVSSAVQRTASRVAAAPATGRRAASRSLTTSAARRPAGASRRARSVHAHRAHARTTTAAGTTASTSSLTLAAFAQALPVCNTGALGDVLGGLVPVLGLVCSAAEQIAGGSVATPADGGVRPASLRPGNGSQPLAFAASTPRAAFHVRGDRHIQRGGGSGTPTGHATAGRGPGAGVSRVAGLAAQSHSGMGFAGSGTPAAGRGAPASAGRFGVVAPPSSSHKGPLAFLTGGGSSFLSATGLLAALLAASCVFLAGIGIRRLTLRLLPR